MSFELLFRMFTDKSLIEFSNGMTITYYACCYVVGIYLAIVLACREMKKIGLPKMAIIDGTIVCVVLCIIGARLYYFICDPSQFTKYSSAWDNILYFFGFKEGLSGLSITGAVIVAVVYIIVFARVKKLNVWKIFDVAAPGLLVGQIIGRWGNFFNQEAHGGPMSEKAYNVLSKIIPSFIMNKMHFQDLDVSTGQYITAYWHPTFLYEGLWNTVGLILILVGRRKFKKVRTGDMIGFYLFWYGLGRATLIEPFRTDPLYFGSVKANILMPALFAAAGLLFLVIRHTLWKDKYYNEIVEETMANKPQALLFRLEDVCVNTKSYLRNAYYSTLYSNNSQVTNDELDKLIQDGPKVVFANNPEGYEQFMKYLHDHIDDCKRVHGDSRNLIELFFKQNKGIACISEFDKEITLEFLSALRLNKWVSLLITSDLEDNSLEYAKKALNRENILFICATESDCKKGSDLGMKPCLVTGTKHFEAATDCNPTYIINDFNEVFELIYE